MKEEGSGGELGSDLDLDPDPWKILWIRIRQNDMDPLDPDPDPQHCHFYELALPGPTGASHAEKAFSYLNKKNC